MQLRSVRVPIGFIRAARCASLSRDIGRFLRLSDDFVVLDSGRDNVLIDIRYSMIPVEDGNKN